MTLEEYLAQHPGRSTTASLICRYLTSPLNLVTLSVKLGLHKDHVRRELNHLHEAGLIHIYGWERAGKRKSAPWRPLWSAGGGPDAPMPVVDRLEIRREYQRLRRAREANAKAVRNLKAKSLAEALLLG